MSAASAAPQPDPARHIITVNSYPAARHNLMPIGLGDLTRELNLRSVVLAQEARDRCAAIGQS